MINASTCCLAFDLDDTLYLERDYVASGLHAVARWARDEIALDGLYERAWGEFESGTRGSIFDRSLARLGVRPAPELVRRMVDIYRAHVPRITLLPDARRCIEQLRNRVPLAVITDGPAASQRAKVAALGLTDWAAVVIVTSELGDGYAKPHIKAFEIVERVTGREGSMCLYVADNPAKDFAGPKRIGWTTVRVRRVGGLHHAAASGDDVDLEVADLDALVECMIAAPSPLGAGDA